MLILPLLASWFWWSSCVSLFSSLQSSLCHLHLMRLAFFLKPSRRFEYKKRMLWNHSQSQVWQQKTMPFPSKVPGSDHTCPRYKAALKAQYTTEFFLLLYHTLFFVSLCLIVKWLTRLDTFLNSGWTPTGVCHSPPLQNPLIAERKSGKHTIPQYKYDKAYIPESMGFTCPLWHCQWFNESS